MGSFLTTTSSGRSFPHPAPCVCHSPCFSSFSFASSLFVWQHHSQRWTAMPSTFMLSTGSTATQSTDLMALVLGELDRRDLEEDDCCEQTQLLLWRIFLLIGQKHSLIDQI